MERGAGDLNAANGGREARDVDRIRRVGQQRDELPSARTDVAGAAHADVERVERERERETDGDRGDPDERAGQRARRQEVGDDEAQHEREGRQHPGDADGEPPPAPDDVEELDDPQRRQGRRCALRSAAGQVLAAHRVRSLPVGSLVAVERQGGT